MTQRFQFSLGQLMWLLASGSLAAAIARWNNLQVVPASIFLASAIVFTGSWLMQYQLRAVRLGRIMRRKSDLRTTSRRTKA